MWELMRLALGGIWRTPLRVVLTALGVAIATGSLVAMVGYALGIQAKLEEPFQKLELFNRLEVSPKAAPPPSDGKDVPKGAEPGRDKSALPAVLDDDALTKIRELSGVAVAYPDFRLREVTIVRPGKREKTSALGLPYESGRLPYVKASIPADGRFFEEDGGPQALVGSQLARSLGFDPPAEAVGQTLTLEVAGLVHRGGRTFEHEEQKVPVQVVGIWEPSTTRLGFSTNFLILPSDQIQQLPGSLYDATRYTPRPCRTDSGREYRRLVVRVLHPGDLFWVEKRIQDMGYHVDTSLKQFEDMRKAFLIMKFTLWAVGSVALVVAGLGIVNTMLMAVLERYREIGTYKALGASNGDVRILFLAEASLVGLLGGVGGIGLGRLVCWLIELGFGWFARSYGIEDQVVAFDFPLKLLGGALLFAVVVSLISGVYPASRAARVDPIRALRAE
jgi:putative ABC transport system permease protein